MELLGKGWKTSEYPVPQKIRGQPQRRAPVGGGQGAGGKVQGPPYPAARPAPRGGAPDAHNAAVVCFHDIASQRLLDHRQRLHRLCRGAGDRFRRRRHLTGQGKRRFGRNDKARRAAVLQSAVFRLRHGLQIHHRRRDRRYPRSGLLPDRGNVKSLDTFAQSV